MSLRALAASLFALGSSAAPAFAGVRAGDGWVRATPVGAPTAAAYLTLTNTGPASDRLLGGSTPEAASLGVHSMSMAGGIMRMRAMDEGLALPPGATVRLRPSGDHLMLTGLKRPLRAGERARITLRFQHAGALRLSLPVRDAPPPG